MSMTIREFMNGVKVLWNIERHEYLACINQEDREHFGDTLLMERFRRDPHRAFCALPTQDQERVFAIITERNKKAGIT